MFRLLEHRLWLEIAIGIDLAGGDSCQRGIDRFGIELSTGEGKLRVNNRCEESSSQLFHVSNPRSLKPVRNGPGFTVATSIPNSWSSRLIVSALASTACFEVE